MPTGLLAACLALASHSTALQSPQRVLIVGGGPDLSHNQVAIESNVRYVMRMLPTNLPTRVLFADGDPNSKNVLFEDPPGRSQYRAPQISHIDGPSRLDTVHVELANAGKDASTKSPVFLYFTGHGSPNVRSDYVNNQFDLWRGEALTVRDLAQSLNAYPKGVPVTLLMVECFSGAFGNELFEDGDPQGQLVDRPICGFFASIAQRPAAGCTPEVNEANYRDFTSYFVAQLTGTDRLGKPASGADYNHDGKVGMNEAFAYALIHDDSIDTPVCTSDVFLRHFVTLQDSEIFGLPYTNVETWAAPAQRAALQGLSSSLSLAGEDRNQQAFDEFRRANLGSDRDRDVHMIRYVRLVKSIVLAHNLTDRDLKRRYDALLKLESGNPFAS